MPDELKGLLREALTSLRDSDEKRSQYPIVTEFLEWSRQQLEAEPGEVAAKELLSTQQKHTLSEISDLVLFALESVAKSAQSALSFRSGERTLTVTGGGEQALRNLESITAQSRSDLERLSREPFVARIVTQWQDKQARSQEIFYISRASGGRGLPDGQLASYFSPIGRLAEFEAGEFTTVVFPNGERDVRLVERTLLHPTRGEDGWDARDVTFEFAGWRTALGSLRRFVSDLKALGEAFDNQDLLGSLLREDAELELFRQAARRKVIDKIALRDQPILDQYQGAIFRMPLDRQLFLFGPPGSGKTTTLIRRLAQKRTSDALTDDERSLLKGDTGDAFFRQDSWAMFSPTELLKLYLRDAFNREGVPAAETTNLRTWERERLDLGRNVLNILRATDSGIFQLDHEMNSLTETSSKSISRLYDEFATHVDSVVTTECNDAIELLEHSEEEGLRGAIGRLRRSMGVTGKISTRDLSALLDIASDLLPEIKRVEEQIDDGVKRIVNRLLAVHREVLDQVVELLQNIEPSEAAQDEEESEDDSQTPIAKLVTKPEAAKLIVSAVRSAARAASEKRTRVGGIRGRILSLLRDRLPPTEELATVGALIVTLARLRTVTRSPRRLVLGVPRIYARFRQQVAKEGRLFRPEMSNQSSAIAPDEVNVIILAMLRNARRLLTYGNSQRLLNSTNHEWLESIKSRYLMQVFVDEATDFSAVQLGCMLELAHPRLKSWFACGDLQQRITVNGLEDLSELEWLKRGSNARIDLEEVTIGYRQTPRLRELTASLFALENSREVALEAPRGFEESDVWPIIGEHLSGPSLCAWLAERIVEVEQSVGRLPSIALFVDGDESIDPLVRELSPFLARHNIRVVGCKEGRIVGDALEVRVFDVRHIKGLEFEAVFLVAIDRLANKLPELFHRFIYVGATRAATYLALTSEGSLPHYLEKVRPCFQTEGWAE